MQSQIHSDDDMYVGSLGHYEQCGKQFADIIGAAAQRATFSSPRILELPCGYGRVTRHLVKFFLPEKIVVADAIAPAVEFCIEQFGVSGIEVGEPLNEFINIPNGAFDVAAMGSLITHLSEDSAETVLKHFFSKLTPQGIALITTHGVRAHEILLADSNWFELIPSDREFLKAAYQEDKFGYVQYAPDHSFEKKTVECVGKSYGISLIPHSWMVKTVNQLGYSVLDYQKGGWDNHQDVFVIAKK